MNEGEISRVRDAWFVLRDLWSWVQDGRIPQDAGDEVPVELRSRVVAVLGDDPYGETQP